MADAVLTATSSRRHFLRAGMVVASAGAVAAPLVIHARSVDERIADHLEAARALMASRNPGNWRIAMVPNADVAMIIRDR